MILTREDQITHQKTCPSITKDQWLTAWAMEEILLSELWKLPPSEGHNHSANKEVKEPKDLFTIVTEPHHWILTWAN